jgi:outer membrane protein Omp28
MIKRVFTGFAFAILSLIFYSSCDRVDPPYTQGTNTGPDTTGNGNPDSLAHVQDSLCSFGSSSPHTYRKVLIEDYTGHLCGNCPYAAGVLYNTLKPLYGDTLISIGVHASAGQTFTETCPPYSYPPGASAPAYSDDFRTVAGEAWLAFFGVSSNPKGMVSRLDYPTSTHVKSPTAWGSATASIIGEPAKVGIQILNTYDSTSGNLSTCIKSTFLSSLNGTYNLSVLLTEDSIKGWQENYALPNNPPLYYNDSAYTHRHVLRGAINSTWGVQLKSGTVAVGDSVRKTYTVNLLNLPASMNTTHPSLNINRCSVVAFVYDYTTKEILQVEEQKVR